MQEPGLYSKLFEGKEPLKYQENIFLFIYELNHLIYNCL